MSILKRALFDGKIGRLRYFTYCFLNSLWLPAPLLFMVAIGRLFGIESGSEQAGMIAPPLVAVSFIGAFVTTLIIASKRLRDLGYKPHYCFLMFVPLVNIILGFILLFKAGSQHNSCRGT